MSDKPELAKLDEVIEQLRKLTHKDKPDKPTEVQTISGKFMPIPLPPIAEYTPPSKNHPKQGE